MDLSALGAQALAQVEKARKAAAEQLAAAMNQKPKLDLTLELDAPKIAIPVPATEDGRGMTAQAAVADAVAHNAVHLVRHAGLPLVCCHRSSCARVSVHLWT